MLKIATLASGSSGNCSVVSDGRVHILIDAGISARRITTGLEALGIRPEEVAAILITHEHADHISGLRVLSRQLSAPLYTAEATARQICRRIAGLEQRFWVFDPGERFAVGDLAIGTFPTSHDCACPVGYSVSNGAERLAVCTDLGEVTQQALAGVRGAGLLLGEFNYDLELLRSGPYPAMLKQRILSRLGHLSNQDGGRLAAWAVEHGARRVVLGHLSKENNRPELALAAAEQAVTETGARVGRDVLLSTAPRSECSGWLEV